MSSSVGEGGDLAASPGIAGKGDKYIFLLDE